jgi:Protein of unknown function (DUF1569)
MTRRHLLDDDTYAQVLQRIGTLTPQSTRRWGKMDAAQMLAHCAEVLEVTNGKALNNTPWFIRMIGPLVKRVITSDKPYRHDSPTHPQYVMTSSKDFTHERARLLEVLAALRAAGPRPIQHPIFGKMSADEVGWSAYKHLDHHLQQFGA